MVTNAELAKVASTQTDLKAKSEANEKAVSGLTGRVANVETGVQTAQTQASNALNQSTEAKATSEQANNNATQAKTEAQTAIKHSEHRKCQ